MILLGSFVLFLALTGLLYTLGVNVWLGPQTIIDRIAGQDYSAHETAHPSLAFRDMLNKLGNLVPASTKDIGALQKRLIRAGIRAPNALRVFYGIKLVLVVLMLIAAVVITLRLHQEGMDQLLWIAAAGALEIGRAHV